MQARAYLLGEDVDPDRAAVTTGQWLDLWLEIRSVSFSTRRIYAQHIRDYLKPHLGSVPLRQLTTGRIQAMFTSLLRIPGARGGPLSAATLHKIRGVLHAALNGAIRRGLIERNPAHWVELPPARRPKAVVWTGARVAHWQATGERPRVAVWTAEQTATFLEASQDHELFGLYLLVALVGLRRGEAAGLRWCDLDLNNGLLMVSHQVQDHNGRVVICPPKTPNSVRTVALPRLVVTMFRHLYDAQRRVSGGVPTGFVFVTARGASFSPGYLTHAFRRLAARAGVPPIRLHDLRHGAASLMLAAGGELKVVQDTLGHGSIVLTADTYTSLLPCLAHQTAEATAALVLQAAHRINGKIRGHSRRTRSRYGPRRRRVGQLRGTAGNAAA